MRTLEFTVPFPYRTVRLKSFLQSYCGVSSRLLARLKRTPMGILVNGRQAIVTDCLRAGDHVSLTLPQDEKCPKPSDLPLSVVYEDQDLMAVSKPSGMPMYPSPGHDCDSLANAFSSYCAARGERISFRPVYRLDRDTTGLIVLAKHSFAAAALSGKIRKTYLAVCEGTLRGSGVIDRPIGLKEGHTIQRAVRPDGERAVTRWRSLFSGRGCTLLALRLKTGRTHQIRVHLSDLHHPLVGDDFYGGSLSLMRRQALHCAEIRLVHPVSKRRLRLVCEMDEDMQKLVDFIRGFGERNEIE